MCVVIVETTIKTTTAVTLNIGKYLKIYPTHDTIVCLNRFLKKREERYRRRLKYICKVE